MTEYVEFEYSEAVNRDVLHEGIDTFGNVVLLNGGNEAIRWRDQDDPWYFNEEELSNGNGPGVAPADNFWFDYIDGTKVTHLSVKDLTFTHLDGSAYPEATFVAHSDDSRVTVFNTTKLDPILVTYNAGKTNNKMVIRPELGSHLYSAAEKSIDSYVSASHVNVLKGKTKDLWMHMCDSWEEARFEADPANLVEVNYWDNDAQKEVVLKGDQAADFVNVEAVSVDDPKNLVYKVTLKGNEAIDRFNLNLSYKKYDVNSPEGKWDEGEWIEVNVVEGNTLFACGEWNLFVNGKQYGIKDPNDYNENVWIDTYGNAPFYTALRYVDAEGNTIDITNPADITFYQRTWDDSVQDMVPGDKAPEAPVIVTRVGDTNLLEFTPNGKGSGDYVIGYKDNAPSGLIAFCIGDDEGMRDGFFTSSKASSKTYARDAVNTGLSDTTLYYGISSKDDFVKSGKTIDITLIDENGNDLSAKVKSIDGESMTFANGTATYSNMIVIPKGTLKSSAVLKLHYLATVGEGETEERYANFFVFYNPVGATFTASNVTYVVSDFNSVSVKSVKKSLKKVTIPAKVNGFSVNAIEAKAMKGCKSLKTITVKSTTIKTVGSNAFKGVKKTTTIKVPKAKLKAYKTLFKKGGFKGKVK
ncbi:MAG: leucine-rich repeat protein [Lachnospiraceae bacterium]|nr:leucine-rich repeat protein [Lachnospiraceae bacterium]